MLKLAFLVAMIVGSCATPPKTHSYQKAWEMPAQSDKVWTATVQLFAENNWPIATLEKDSGLIVSDWVSLGAQGGHADCGTAGLSVVERREVRFNVFVKDLDGKVMLTVNAHFRELRSFDNRPYYSDCTSVGSLEMQIYNQIKSRL